MPFLIFFIQFNFLFSFETAKNRSLRKTNRILYIFHVDNIGDVEKSDFNDSIKTIFTYLMIFMKYNGNFYFSFLTLSRFEISL